MKRPWRLPLCLLLAAGTWAIAPEPASLRWGLAIFVGAAALWMTQALPLAVTALLVPVVALLAGLQQPAQAFAPFASPIVFLFLGGLSLAAALQHQGLARAAALAVLRWSGGNRLYASLLLIAMTALASMWMSNTATAALVLPLALSLLQDDAQPTGESERAFVLLALTYSTAIGGMASLVSTPPNVIAGGQAGIGFLDWMLRAAPLALVLWLLMLALLYATLRPRLAGRVAVDRSRIEWTRERIATCAIFGATASGWVFGAPLAQALGIRGDTNALVGVAALVALVACGAVPWRTLEKELPWGVLLLFGGGLALSELMTASGAGTWLVDVLLRQLQGAAPLLVLLGVVAFVVATGELMSNTATAALAVPLFLPLAPALGLAPASMAMAIALASCCGFMLPVATPPNAMVFGTGQVTQGMMMRCGWKLDVAFVLAITATAYGVWR